jgi:quercetin dioxygenase-like cupin family protein
MRLRLIAFVVSMALLAACARGAATPAARAPSPVNASASTDASPLTPVDQEPLHHVVLKNESVVVLLLSLPPGQRTLYHTHTHDRVAIYLSKTSITQQKPNEAEGAPSAISAGAFSAMTLEGDSYTHRVHNVGSEAFEVLDVELQERPQIPSPATAAPVAAEDPSARVYNWVLAPGATSLAHAHARPYLLVAATGCVLMVTAPGGKSSSHEMKRGDFQWVNSKAIHSLGNAGSSEAQIVEIELK